MLVLFFQKERWLSLLMALAGIIALIAASPFLVGLIGGNHSTSPGGIPIAFAVRMFIPVYVFISTYPPVLINLIFLLLLPVNYLMELGFFFLAGLIWIQQYNRKQWKQNPFYLPEIILLSATIFVGSFIRSTAIGNNDLGWRAWLPGQFILLIWSVDVINRLFPNGWHKNEGSPQSTRQIIQYLKLFLIIGLLTTMTDVVLLRTWPMLVDAGVAGFPSKLSPDTQLGKRTFAARLAYDFINLHTQENTIIQDNPADFLNPPIGLYANRAIAISGHTAFGVSVQDLTNRANLISKIYTSANWAEIDQTCITNNIDLIIATDVDPIWKNLPILEQQRNPLYQNRYYAVFACGNRVKP